MSSEAMVQFREQEGFVIGAVTASKVLDALNVTDFGEEVLAYVSAHSGLRLILDFEKVHYLSSAVLTELLRIKDAVEDNGGGIRLAGLRDEHRRVIQLRYLQGRSVEEVAALMDRSPHAVHNLCHRAMRSLRAAMGRTSKYLTRH